MQILFSRFPTGMPALGLLLLRVCLSATALAQGANILYGSKNPAIAAWAYGLTAIVAGILLFVGFLTPFAGILVFIGGMIFIFSNPTGANLNLPAAGYVVAISAAVVLLGPGAFSLDARLFGRREIIIPKH